MKKLFFTENHLGQSNFLIKLHALRQRYQNKTPTRMFSCEYCEILKDTYVKEYLQQTASVGSFKTFHL